MHAPRHVAFPFFLRLGLGLMWIAGATFNAVSTLPISGTFRDDLGQNATFAIYRWFFDSVVGSAPVFWSILLILAELVLGVLLLGKEPWARYGLILSAIWCVFLFFIIWPYTLSTVLLLALSVWLLRYRHPAGILDVVHRHSGHVPSPGTGA